MAINNRPVDKLLAASVHPARDNLASNIQIADWPVNFSQCACIAQASMTQPLSTNSVECLHDNSSQTIIMKISTSIQELHAERNKLSSPHAAGGGHTTHLKFDHMHDGLKSNLTHFSAGKQERPTQYAAYNLVHVKRQHVSQHPHAQLII